jgi:hypothetical protein
MLNLSINSIDFYRADRERGALEQNDYVDSMIEFMVENVMSFSRHTLHAKANMANNSKQQASATHVVLKWFASYTVILNEPAISHCSTNQAQKNDSLVNLYFKEVPVKPPQAVLAC